MTPQEYRKAIQVLAKSMGEDAYIYTSVNTGFSSDEALQCMMYPHGMSRHHGCFSVYADDWAKLLEAAKTKWEEHRLEYGRQATRKMALAIIRITAEQGQCTDAALRAEFSDLEVKQYSVEACFDANVIAGKGPFEVIRLGGSNGAPGTVTTSEPPPRMQ